MFNGYFVQALREAFYRTFAQYSTRSPVITTVESQDYADFGAAYLMGGEL